MIGSRSARTGKPRVLNTLIARPVGLGVSVRDKTGIYAPVGHFVDPEANLPLAEVVSVLREADAAGATSLWYNVGLRP